MSKLRHMVGLISLAAFVIMMASPPVHAQEPPPPQIKDITPREAACGTEVTLTIYGADFRKGLGVSIPEGVETIYTELINSGELEAGLRIAENAPSGTRPVELIDLTNGQRVAVVEPGFTIICERPPSEALPDLVVFDAYWGFARNNSLLQIFARIRNESDVPSPETQVYAQSDAVSWWSAEALVPALGGGNEVTVVIELEILNELRGREHLFRITVNPGNEVPESSAANNQFDLAIEVPVVPGTEIPPEPEPEGGYDPTGLIIIVSIVVVVAGVTITIRRSVKVRRRREYQEKAKEEKPPETCQPCTRYCQKIEIEADLALRKIAYLSLTAASTSSPEDSREGRIEGKVIDRLNNAVKVYRRNKNINRQQKEITAISVSVIQHLKQWLAGGPRPCDVSITAHLTGSKVKCQFYLYHCRQRGEHSVWEEEDKWEATIKDERDETAATLHDLDPAELELAKRFAPALTDSLLRFIQKV